MKYRCNSCGTEHDEWPSLTYASPDNYNSLSEEDKQKLGSLDSDFCICKHTEQVDRFIRCTLTQKVVDHCENLEYGLWVSLSEKSFQDYTDNYDREDYETKYFGWLCNRIPDYIFDESIPTTVFTRLGRQRPEIVPHKDFDHPFVRDYYEGIVKEEAERRIKAMLEIVNNRNE
jgi:hypothetical protein